MPDFTQQISTLDSWIVNNQDKQGTPQFDAVVGDLKTLISQSSAEQPAEDKGFIDKTGESFERRSAMADEIFAAQAQGEQTWAETALQLTGKVGVGAVTDLVFNGAVEGVQALTPDIIGGKITDIATSAAYGMINNPVGQAGLEALYEGVEAYQGWKQENPRMARNLEGVVNIGLVWTPAKGNPSSIGAGLRNLPSRMARRTTNLADDIGRRASNMGQSRVTRAATRRLDRGAVNSAATERQARIIGALTPDEGLKNNMALVEKGKLTPGGQLSNKDFVMDAVDSSAMNDILALTSGRSSNAVHVFNESNQALSKLEGQMRRFFTGGKSQRYSFDDLTARMGQVRARAAADNAMLVSSEQASAVSTLFDDFLTIAAKHPRTAKGLLAARREYDKFVLKNKPNIFDLDAASSAIKNTNLAVRQEANRMVTEMVPEASGLLKRQANIFQVQNTIMRNAALEPRKWVGLQLAKLNGILGTRSIATNVVASVAGVGGLGAAALGAPLWTAGIGVPFVLWNGKKLATSSLAKKAYADLIRGTDKAINLTRAGATELGRYGTTQTVDLLKSFRADRAALVQLLEEGQQ